jgi:hypothetical protein
VIVRNPEGALYGKKGDVWDQVRKNFASAAALDPAPSKQALQRRLKVLVDAKQQALKIYKSGNEEEYEEIDALVEEYIEVIASTKVFLPSLPGFEVLLFSNILSDLVIVIRRSSKKRKTLSF